LKDPDFTSTQGCKVGLTCITALLLWAILLIFIYYTKNVRNEYQKGFIIVIDPDHDNGNLFHLQEKVF
jgi:hypothetical protein